MNLGVVAYKIMRCLGFSQRNRMKSYFSFRPKEKEIFIQKMNQEPTGEPETWREYFIRTYGEIPDWAKYPYSCFNGIGTTDLDTIRPTVDITSLIKNEEEKYLSAINRNTKLIKEKYSDVTKLDGETLSFLHHTYGCDPTMIEEILDVCLPEKLHNEYLAEYALHKLTGKTNRGN